MLLFQKRYNIEKAWVHRRIHLHSSTLCPNKVLKHIFSVANIVLVVVLWCNIGETAQFAITHEDLIIDDVLAFINFR